MVVSIFCLGSIFNGKYSCFIFQVYECAVCFKETEFPRHTDPLKLLQTRRGRCGEWGRCFTFLCLALGWDARLVIDETDHVWTEVVQYVVKYIKCINVFLFSKSAVLIVLKYHVVDL